MLALKLTTPPGIPDTYQGDELDARALVDPDNRRPVDWGWYRAMLARLQGGSPPDRHTAKLYLTMRLLALRIRRPEAFAGDYQPLEARPGLRGLPAWRRGPGSPWPRVPRPSRASLRHQSPDAGEIVLRGERRQLDRPGEARCAELLGRLEESRCSSATAADPPPLATGTPLRYP